MLLCFYPASFALYSFFSYIPVEYVILTKIPMVEIVPRISCFLGYRPTKEASLLLYLGEEHLVAFIGNYL